MTEDIKEILTRIDADLQDINKTLKKMVRKPYRRKPPRGYKFTCEQKL